MNAAEARAWNAFRDVLTGKLTTVYSQEIVEEMLLSLLALGKIMSINVHRLHGRVSTEPVMGDATEEQGILSWVM